MAGDDYGNRAPRINRPNQSNKDSRRGTSQAFNRLTGRAGYVPIRTGRRVGQGGGVAKAYPDKPETWLGSLPEWAIYWAHGVLKLKEHEDFEYLFYYGGVGEVDSFESAQFDFYEYDVGVAIEIQGLFWHYEFGGRRKVQQDAERKARAESSGLTLIFIDEDDALANPIHFLSLARNGIDRSRIARGF